MNRPGQEKERRELTDEEFAAALTGEFAISLTPRELAAAVAAPAGHEGRRRRAWPPAPERERLRPLSRPRLPGLPRSPHG